MRWDMRGHETWHQTTTGVEATILKWFQRAACVGSAGLPGQSRNGPLGPPCAAAERWDTTVTGLMSFCRALREGRNSVDRDVGRPLVALLHRLDLGLARAVRTARGLSPRISAALYFRVWATPQVRVV